MGRQLTTSVTTTTYPLNSLTFVANGCCRFTGFVAAPIVLLSLDACLKNCEEDQTCIAADMKAPNSQFEYLCTKYQGTGSNFNTQCGKSNPSELCYRKYSAVQSATLTFSMTTTVTTSATPVVTTTAAAEEVELEESKAIQKPTARTALTLAVLASGILHRRVIALDV